MTHWTMQPHHSRKRELRDERALSMGAELRRLNGGPLLRVQRACNIWCRVLPDGPRVSYATLRALRARGHLTRLRAPDMAGRETYLLTGGGTPDV